jgi:hypothetical protein
MGGRDRRILPRVMVIREFARARVVTRLLNVILVPLGQFVGGRTLVTLRFLSAVSG